jgi:hypothetical protein
METVATAPGAVPQRSAPTSAPSRPVTRRPTAPPRPQPALTFNYTYLGHDIRLLGVLAPAMVILLIVAYFVLH